MEGCLGALAEKGLSQESAQQLMLDYMSSHPGKATAVDVIKYWQSRENDYSR